jgi:CelD/BcsL family acetyltransferase involved in cellulose biosynthesis
MAGTEPEVVPLAAWWQDAAMQRAWHRLAEPCPQFHPFQHPAWIHAVGNGARNAAAHLGLAAFQRTGPNRLDLLLLLARCPGPLGWLRSYEFVGDPLNDTNSFCYRVDLSPKDLLCSTERLLEKLPAWDLLVLREIPQPSATLKALLRAARNRQVRYDLRPSVAVPVVDAVMSWESFLHSRSHRFRRTLSGLENRWRRAGVTSRTLASGDLDERSHEETLELCAEIERRSGKPPRQWTVQAKPERARPGLLALARAGHLRYDLVERNGETIAFLISLVLGSTVFAYVTAYDSSHTKVSPGTRLFRDLIADCMHDPVVELISLGRGAPYHKTRWETGREQRVHLRLYAPHLRGRLIRCLAAVVRRLGGRKGG